jgi:hypothetical protein
MPGRGQAGFTPLSDAKQAKLVSRDIPYRLGALDLGVMVSREVLGLGDPSLLRTTLHRGETLILQSTGRLFANVAVEHAMMTCRAMMECLGLRERDLKLVDDRGQHRNTVTLEHFGLPLLTAGQAIAYLNDPEQIDGLVHTFHSATLAGAHLTMVDADLAPELLAAGCRATRKLVDHFLYEALGQPAPASLLVPPLGA